MFDPPPDAGPTTEEVNSPRLVWTLNAGSVCQLPVPWSHSSLNAAAPPGSEYSIVIGLRPGQSFLVTSVLVPQL